MRVTSIEAIPQGDGIHRFNVVLQDRHVSQSLDLSAAELLSYYGFQRIVLEKTGEIFLDEVASGRSPEVADYFWSIMVRALITASREDRRQMAAAGEIHG